MTAAPAQHATHARIASSAPPAVLIGTPRTLSEAVRLLPDGGPHVAGMVLVADPEADAGPAPEIVGLPTLGSLEALGDLHDRLGVAMAIVCLPLDEADLIARVRAEIGRAGLEERFVPAIADLLTRRPPVLVGVGSSGPTMATTPRIDLQSLIGRPMRTPDPEPLRDLLRGKRVLVTGAGGSIGAELATLCGSFEPSAIMLMERAENALFEIDRRLATRFPQVRRAALLHDVVDADGTRRLVTRHRPDVVFHAAAHKHVPLMEDHPRAAIENNVFGTRSIVDAACDANAGRVVLVSTDKAVQPRSVMGATKRIAEAYTLSADARCRADGRRTRTAIVRFGNVLGSSASVLRIWSAQLADGQPITLTDRRMSRYFMTIPEAALLVAHAAAIEPGDAAGIFVLDMADPVPIADLADRFVRAHGLEVAGAAQAGPGRVEIAETGIRPGEKLHEALVHAAERLRPTGVDGVLRLSGTDDLLDGEAALDELRGLGPRPTPEDVVAALVRLVPSLARTQ
ncbi:MAG: polysaccharide biosynthesis protein [Planctomycetota bacterium]